MSKVVSFDDDSENNQNKNTSFNESAQPEINNKTQLLHNEINYIRNIEIDNHLKTTYQVTYLLKIKEEKSKGYDHQSKLKLQVRFVIDPQVSQYSFRIREINDILYSSIHNDDIERLEWLYKPLDKNKSNLFKLVRTKPSLFDSQPTFLIQYDNKMIMTAKMIYSMMQQVTQYHISMYENEFSDKGFVGYLKQSSSRYKEQIAYNSGVIPDTVGTLIPMNDDKYIREEDLVIKYTNEGYKIYIPYTTNQSKVSFRSQDVSQSMIEQIQARFVKIGEKLKEKNVNILANYNNGTNNTNNNFNGYNPENDSTAESINNENLINQHQLTNINNNIHNINNEENNQQVKEVLSNFGLTDKEFEIYRSLLFSFERVTNTNSNVKSVKNTKIVLSNDLNKKNSELYYLHQANANSMNHEREIVNGFIETGLDDNEFFKLNKLTKDEFEIKSMYPFSAQQTFCIALTMF